MHLHVNHTVIHLNSIFWMASQAGAMYKQITFLAGDILNKVNSLDWLLHKTHKCTVRERSTYTVIVEKVVFGSCRVIFY